MSETVRDTMAKARIAEGQIISEENFCVFNSSKNERKISALIDWGKNLNFQVCFLEELKTPKFPFEIN